MTVEYVEDGGGTEAYLDTLYSHYSDPVSSVVGTTDDVQDEPDEEPEEEQGRDAFGRFYGGPVIPELSREELAVVLAAVAHGQAQGANGSVVKKVDGGVYAQLNRPNEDGHLHLYLVVPEVFPLETFKPVKE